jgi:subtilisin-like proprotein convertase family protein
LTLSALTGASPNGLWQLFLDDSVTGVDGEVGGWTLDLTLTKPKKCKKPKGKRAATAKKRCKKKRR